MDSPCFAQSKITFLPSSVTARAAPAPEATPGPRADPGAATVPGADPGPSVAPQSGSHQVGARLLAGPHLGPSPAQSPLPGLAHALLPLI